MNLKRNIIFSLENRKKNGVPILENVPIRMRVVFGGKRIDFTCGHRIDVAKWDAKKQRVKNGCTNKFKESSAEINATLNSMEATIQNIFKEFEVQGIIPSVAQLKAAFNALTKHTEADYTEEAAEPKKSFWDIYDLFVRERGRERNWTAATHQKMAAMRHHLHDFNPALTFEMLDSKGITDYLIFLRDKCDMRNSTILKQLDFLKWFLRWGLDEGHHTNSAFTTYKPKIKNATRPIVYLDWDEMKILREFEIPKGHEYLDKVRDVFLFCCFSGLRYSDVSNLRRNNVYDDRIEFVTIKTTDPLTVQLNRYSKAILDKYADVEFEDNRALPVISNQKMNDYLKVLAEMAGLDRPQEFVYFHGSERRTEILPLHAVISTHAARRSFITFCLAIGINSDTIRSWTGHKDHRAMRPYIAIADKTKAAAMSKIDRFEE